MKRSEVISRFCALSNKVMTQQFKSMEAADCFCSSSRHDLIGFSFSTQVMEFIEKAVEEKLMKTQQARKFPGMCERCGTNVAQEDSFVCDECFEGVCLEEEQDM